MNTTYFRLFFESRGNFNRVKIVNFLHQRPYNINQISKELNLNYRTIKHHLKVLEENKVVQSDGNGYGALFSISDEFDIDKFIKIYNASIDECVMDKDLLREKVIKML
ncbi:MAG: winged helix-turn-helix domain-containing protein [Methanobacterium sp.]|jgi:DNA-binding transcriptional ArsR family regulator|uniref:ArsR/SmtB family transcription factor n=1 Tax=Methanobacterium sp. TaxID=2164 RepID=UPI00258B2D29|nr:winged helix-turn-helix domain-containing protein [Methanobacterium sp.]MCC7559400.1 winged helix-turn-helix domain-containing protein [Methanobacterium sp.]